MEKINLMKLQEMRVGKTEFIFKDGSMDGDAAFYNLVKELGRVDSENLHYNFIKLRFKT